MNNLKLLIAATLLLASYQGRAQQSEASELPKRKRMFFYPNQETSLVLTVKPLRMHPNPASLIAEVHLPETAGRNKKGFSLEICNKHGLLVHSQTWSGEKIDVSQFPPGIYIVTLKRKQEVYSQKLVVSR